MRSAVTFAVIGVGVLIWMHIGTLIFACVKAV